MATEMVRDVPSLLFGMDILSAGQCAAGNSSAFVPDETIAGDRSTSNADWWICDFYDSAGGRQCGGIFGTGSSNDSASMVHKDKICSSFSSRAFSGVIFEAMNWKWSCRYQCRGICRGEENAKFLIFELDESRILIRKNQYEQIEDRSMNLKCRLYRSKWVQSIAASDVMESGQVVENPMIGAIPSRNEVQRELDDLLMSM